MELSTLDALLAKAERPEAEYSLCLDGSLNLEWERIDKELTELTGQSVTLAGAPGKAELVKQIEALQERMSEATITLRLRALPRADFRKLTDQHPPRQDVQVDSVMGVNQSTFYDALIAACLVAPELNEPRLTALLDKLTDRQFDDLASKAWTLNRHEVGAPLPLTASLIAASGGGKSKPRPGSGSAGNGSSAGSRKKSSSTSTTKAVG